MDCPCPSTPIAIMKAIHSNVLVKNTRNCIQSVWRENDRGPTSYDSVTTTANILVTSVSVCVCHSQRFCSRASSTIIYPNPDEYLIVSVTCGKTDLFDYCLRLNLQMEVKGNIPFFFSLWICLEILNPILQKIQSLCFLQYL